VGVRSRQSESFWTKRSGWVAVAIAAVVCVLDYLLDRLLVLRGVSRVQMLLFASSITGVVAGGLFYQLARHERAQREIMRARMATIAEMNHHIRNALQVIRGLSIFPCDPSYRDEQIQLINDSVERIEWALREVLPKYPAGEIASPPPIGHKRLLFLNRLATRTVKRAKT
jgi:signal transduction histidine kinase